MVFWPYNAPLPRGRFARPTIREACPAKSRLSASSWEASPTGRPSRPHPKSLSALGVPHESKIVSAHRTPDRMSAYAKSAAGRGLKVIIAGAGGAAHLPGMTASMTTLPVLGVPVESKALKGMDSLLVDRPDAGRRAGGDLCHRRRRRQERSAACRRHSRAVATRHSPNGWRTGAPNRPKRSPKRRPTNERDQAA